MNWLKPRQREHGHYDSYRRAEWKKALLFWLAVLFCAVVIIIFVWIQSLGRGPAMNTTVDPMRDWRQQLD
jgi:hypothetical protein